MNDDPVKQARQLREVVERYNQEGDRNDLVLLIVFLGIVLIVAVFAGSKLL